MEFRKIVTSIIIMALLAASTVFARRDMLVPRAVEKRTVEDGDRRIINRGFHAQPSPRNLLNLQRENPWSLPKLSAEEAETVDTLRICAMRFEFVEEVPDEDSTTGNGKFDLRDYETFLAEEQHGIDPAPHNKAYFEDHLRALRNYYYFVSEGKLELVYEVFPAGDTDAYQLPHPMRYYGEPHPQEGLTNYFLDCFLLVDTIDESIDFSEYDSYFLFHAGSDRQNDIFPDATPPGGDTPFDLFTGYIFLIDSVLGLDKVYENGFVVDSTEVMDALIMPETGSQDNRATAINAVMAHEFGHQLGLIDLYRTDNFATRIGDFGLMDNNGFGAGVDFGFEFVGRAFGVFPVYPMAWSRAFLGFDEPAIFRQGTSIRLAASEMQTDDIEIAKIPISEYEYYLLENRQIDLDGLEPAAWADHESGVIKGPIVYSELPWPLFDTTITGEYDFLLPGSGMLIWKIDEAVAFMDYDGNGRINYFDNQLQLDPGRPFVKLIEADGLVNFGAEYYSGFGSQEDMFYSPNKTSFTPYTNPPAVAHGGANTHVYITNISESRVNMTFDVENGLSSPGFPRRAGVPLFGLSPIAADIDGDGLTEIMAASVRNLIVVREDGAKYFDYGPEFIDTSFIMSRTGDYPTFAVPLFARTEDIITAGPVTGDFGLGGDSQYVAIGAGPWLHVYTAVDNDLDGHADELFDSVNVFWDIVWMSFGEDLTVATMDSINNLIRFTRVDNTGMQVPASPPTGIQEPELFGATRVNGNYALIAGDTAGISLYYITGTTDGDVYNFDLGGYYNYGPVAADLNRDSLYEIVVATPDGAIKAVTIDENLSGRLRLYDEYFLGDSIYANPVIADLDRNGYPDIVLGGRNKIYALDKNFVSLLNFPLTIDIAYPYDIVLSPPVIGDINNDHIKDIVVLTSLGNAYAFGSQHNLNDELLFGFPISAGGIGVGSPLLYETQTGGGLGFLGIDGWFYSYTVGYDMNLSDWPMGGGNPEATYFFPSSKLDAPQAYADMLPEDKFFGYPNPSLDGMINLYYELGAAAEVSLKVFDMSGKKVDEGTLPGDGDRFDETWDLSHLPTGIYRCIIEANFVTGESGTAFTDIAIVK